MTAEKARWRERFRAQRQAMGVRALAEASTQVAARLAALIDECESAGAVALFWPLPGEIDLRVLAETFHQRGVVVALPTVVGPRQIEWRRFEGAERLVEGQWGLREPGLDAEGIAPDTLVVVAVPGLAFGRDGSRLGYGGGFYDAALAETGALRVGVAVSDALVDAVPSESHDARLDAVITEAETWWVRSPPPLQHP